MTWKWRTRPEVVKTGAGENTPWYQHEEVGYNYRMSNVIAGVVGVSIRIWKNTSPEESHLGALPGLSAGSPVKMNPFDPETSCPNYWLSALVIDRSAMCRQVRSDNDALYLPEQGKSCPTEILEAIAGINAEGRPIWKPMHMQPMYRMNGFITPPPARAGQRPTPTLPAAWRMWVRTSLNEVCACPATTR